MTMLPIIWKGKKGDSTESTDPWIHPGQSDSMSYGHRCLLISFRVPYLPFLASHDSHITVHAPPTLQTLPSLLDWFCDPGWGRLSDGVWMHFPQVWARNVVQY